MKLKKSITEQEIKADFIIEEDKILNKFSIENSLPFFKTIKPKIMMIIFFIFLAFQMLFSGREEISVLVVLGYCLIKILYSKKHFDANSYFQIFFYLCIIIEINILKLFDQKLFDQSILLIAFVFNIYMILYSYQTVITQTKLQRFPEYNQTQIIAQKQGKQQEEIAKSD